MTFTEFSWNKPKNQYALLEMQGDRLKLSDDVLINNIRWFISFRWVLIAALILFEILMLLASNTFAQLGIPEQQNWPIAVIIVLVFANISYIYALNHCQSSNFN